MITTKIERRDFIKKMGLGSAAMAISGMMGSCGKEKIKKPNVIIINVDDLGWTDLGCMGSRYYETPNIDCFAGQGVKFSNAYAAAAVCSPTRAAIMTGRAPARLGITDWIRARFQGSEIPSNGKNPSGYVADERGNLLCPENPLWMELEEITIAEVLKQVGYTTCHIGKWHLGPDNWYPDKQGFDRNIGGCDLGQPPTYFDPYVNERRGQKYDIPTLEPRETGEYLTDREGDEAVNFIRQNADKPFFLNMCHYAVHTPIMGKTDLIEKYKNKTPTNQKNPPYAAMVDSVDQSVGKILRALDELKLADNTLVIFTSDNGGLVREGVATDNSPLRSGKGYPYEGGIRVPLIVRWPSRFKGGRTTDTPAISMDLFPTICSAVGQEMPGNRPIDGEDLLPLLESDQVPERDSLFWHFPHYRESDIKPYSIVRAGDWKLIRRYEGKRYKLYNLADDIGERDDLASKMPEKVAELEKRLDRWLDDVGAKLPKLAS